MDDWKEALITALLNLTFGASITMIIYAFWTMFY